MGWELANLVIGHGGELAQPFEFEIVFMGSKQQAEFRLRGDGVVLRTGKVRFNRLEELKDLASGAGYHPQNFIDYLADMVTVTAARAEMRTA